MKGNYARSSRNGPNIISYTEKILNMQIADHRKFAISLLPAPYFVNRQHLSDSDSFVPITLKIVFKSATSPSILYIEKVPAYDQGDFDSYRWHKECKDTAQNPVP